MEEEVVGVRDEVRASELSGREPYTLLTGSVVPRAIAWVATVSPDGVANIAPFSFFTIASDDPPTVCFSIGTSIRADAPIKDTLANIRATGEMTVNIARVALLDAVTATGVAVPAEVDEFTLAGLTPEPSALIGAPRIAEAPVAMECRLDRIVAVGRYSLVLAEVLLWRFEEGVRDGTHVDLQRLEPLGRLSGPRYIADMRTIVAGPPVLDGPRP